jgi:hypothetical protein
MLSLLDLRFQRAYLPSERTNQERFIALFGFLPPALPEGGRAMSDERWAASLKAWAARRSHGRKMWEEGIEFQ